MKKLNLSAIRIDGGTQPRERINMEVVGDYAEAVKVGIEFPPVVVFHDGAEHWLADGFHRYHAHKQAEKTTIHAEVRQGTLLDAKLYAVGANGSHGLRRTNDDKRRSVQMVLDEPAWKEWSDRKVADACGVSVPFVSAIRRPEVAVRQHEQRAASSGRQAPGRNPITPTQISRESERPKLAPVQPPAPQQPDDGPDVVKELESAHAEITKLTAEIQAAEADDLKAEAIKWRRSYEHAQRQQSEAMDRAHGAAEREKWTMRQLRRCGKAIGEDDPTKIAAAVEAFVRQYRKAA